MTGVSETRASRHSHQEPTPRLGPEAAKRALDIAVSLAAALALAPLLAVLWLLVRSTSAGPGLFRQERLGRDMRRFRMLKLRTMYIGDSDQIHREYVAGLVSGDHGPGPRGLFKLETDPRITRSGHGCAGPAWMSSRSYSTCSGGTCPWWDRALRFPGRQRCGPRPTRSTGAGSR